MPLSAYNRQVEFYHFMKMVIEVYNKKMIISKKLEKVPSNSFNVMTRTRSFLYVQCLSGKINNPCNLGALVTMETIETDLLT